MNCRTACDRLNAHLDMLDYPKFKEIIDSIASISEDFFDISQREINQLSDFRLFSNRELAKNVLKSEEIMPGSFSTEQIEFSKELLEKTNSINYARAESSITKLNGEFIEIYETKFRNLLKLSGATFERINVDVRKKANDIIRIGRK